MSPLADLDPGVMDPDHQKHGSRSGIGIARIPKRPKIRLRIRIQGRNRNTSNLVRFMTLYFIELINGVGRSVQRADKALNWSSVQLLIGPLHCR